LEFTCGRLTSELTEYGERVSNLVSELSRTRWYHLETEQGSKIQDILSSEY